MNNVTPIRNDLEQIYIDPHLKRDLVNALNTDVDRVAREALDRGRIQGCISMALFVMFGIVIAELWPV